MDLRHKNERQWGNTGAEKTEWRLRDRKFWEGRTPKKSQEQEEKPSIVLPCASRGWGVSEELLFTNSYKQTYPQNDYRQHLRDPPLLPAPLPTGEVPARSVEGCPKLDFKSGAEEGPSSSFIVNSQFLPKHIT